jgi:hypothetical protein
MAVRTYGVTVESVCAVLPVNTRKISATTPLSTTGITGYIEDGSGRVTAALKRVGVDPDSLDDDTTSQVRAAIEHYAVAASMARLGRTSSSVYTEAKRAYDDVLARFESSGVSLAQQVSSVETTIDTTPNSESRGFFTSRRQPW